MRRVGIVGSRRRLDKDAVGRLVSTLKASDVVVSGGCRGIDRWSIEFAEARHLSHHEHLPVILPGMSRDEIVQAYYTRNRRLANDVDLLYAFVSQDRTGGTENTIGYAKEFGCPVIIVPEAAETETLNAPKKRRKLRRKTT